jgi:hypothetical protein
MIKKIEIPLLSEKLVSVVLLLWEILVWRRSCAYAGQLREVGQAIASDPSFGSMKHEETI